MASVGCGPTLVTPSSSHPCPPSARPALRAHPPAARCALPLSPPPLCPGRRATTRARSRRTQLRFALSRRSQRRTPTAPTRSRCARPDVLAGPDRCRRCRGLLAPPGCARRGAEGWAWAPQGCGCRCLAAAGAAAGVRALLTKRPPSPPSPHSRPDPTRPAPILGRRSATLRARTPSMPPPSRSSRRLSTRTTIWVRAGLLGGGARSQRLGEGWGSGRAA